MLKGLEKSLAKQVERGKKTQDEADAIRARVSATTALAALADADLIIESVVEDLAVKKALFAELDGVVQPTAIIATNTSTLPVVEMAMVTNRPSLVCGVHFFNPATAMSLVEIVAPITASEETLAAVTEFAVACGKEPVRVKDQAGFIVNALLFPYLNNADVDSRWVPSRCSTSWGSTPHWRFSRRCIWSLPTPTTHRFHSSSEWLSPVDSGASPAWASTTIGSSHDGRAL
jgi:3-hydroxyacyl-CoA dehydrogenase